MRTNGIQAHGDVAVRPRYKLCPECGEFAPHVEKIDFCMRCSARMIDECPSCREPILYPTALYCPVCGVGLRNTNGKRLNLPT